MTQQVACSINLSIWEKNSQPAVEIRKIITDPKLLRYVVLSALEETPIVIQPKFTDKLRSINTMIDKGIMFYEKGQYFFVNYEPD